MTPVTSRFDVHATRSRFPALAAREDGRPIAYLDGPGGSQVPREVIDAMPATSSATTRTSAAPSARAARPTA